MPNYYNHEDYVSLKNMKNWNKDDKAEQIELNWFIRLNHYAQKHVGYFRKSSLMIAKWLRKYDSSVPPLRLMRVAKLYKDMCERFVMIYPQYDEEDPRRYATGNNECGLLLLRMMTEYFYLKNLERNDFQQTEN